MTAPILNNLVSSLTYSRPFANAAQQIIDTDVAFSDAEANFNGATVTLMGYGATNQLVEDQLAIHDQGLGPGLISVAGHNVSFGGMKIGSYSGGLDGAPLAVTLNANATNAAVDALIQNLTYANTSDTPTLNRDLVLNVRDAAGEDLGLLGTGYTELAGAANPFNGLGSAQLSFQVAPTLFDYDNDGDLDLFTGGDDGVVHAFQNNGAGVFSSINPFSSYDIGDASAIAFADMNGDGFKDAFITNGLDGWAEWFKNNGNGTFTNQTMVGGFYRGDSQNARPAAYDVDGDGREDFVIGGSDGHLQAWHNNGNGTLTQMGANPFSAIVLPAGSYPSPTFADVDHDGDLDLLLGDSGGHVHMYANNNNVFTRLSAASDPFSGIAAGGNVSPAWGDIDGDHDPDLILGGTEAGLTGALHTWRNDGVGWGKVIHVTVNPTAYYDGTAGADTFYAFTNDAWTINGAGGNDTLFGLGGADTISGNDGNDALNGAQGNDTLIGGVGDDSLNGGLDSDTASYATAIAGVQLDLRVTAAQNTFGAGTDTLTNIENLSGSNYADALTGDAGNNVLTGNAGSDTLVGNYGDDILYGNQGIDSLDGGAGNDTLDGGFDIDTATYLSAVSGVTVDLRVLTAQNTVGSGNDTLSNIENLSGTLYGDTLTGNSLNNVIAGLSGNDTLAGNLGNDTLSGNQGNDTLDGGAGDDTLDGGVDIDTVSYGSAIAGVAVDLRIATAQNTGGAGNDTLTNFENLSGSLYGDTLNGNSLDNILSGSSGNDGLFGNFGNDTLSGNQNNDTLDGGAGNDTLDGGADIDTASYASATAGVTVDLRIAGSQNTLGAGTDTLVNIENVSGSAFVDTLTGNSIDNVLTGLAGNDSLIGNFGNDTLNGGAGLDSLSGGVGNDTFVFDVLETSATADTIADFTSGGDHINLSVAAFASLAAYGLGPLDPGELTFGSAASTAGQYLIYDQAAGNLYYDADGSGATAQVLIAHLNANPAIVTGDIVLI